MEISKKDAQTVLLLVKKITTHSVTSSNFTNPSWYVESVVSGHFSTNSKLIQNSTKQTILHKVMLLVQRCW